MSGAGSTTIRTIPGVDGSFMKRLSTSAGVAPLWSKPRTLSICPRFLTTGQSPFISIYIICRRRETPRSPRQSCRLSPKSRARRGLAPVPRSKGHSKYGVVDIVGSRSDGVRGGGAHSPASITAAPGPGTRPEHLPIVVDCRRCDRFDSNSRLTGAVLIFIYAVIQSGGDGHAPSAMAKL